MAVKSGWGFEEYLLKRSQEWLRKYVPEGLSPSEKEWKLSRFFNDRRVRRAVYEDTNYDPTLPYQHFKAKSLIESNYVLTPITVFDIETDDYGKPISISAIKLQLNKTTGQFDIADTYQRFYESSNRNLSKSYQVHGLGSNTLRKLRSQQGATYSRKYNDTEMKSFQDFIGKSIIAGHNINEYDVPHLFPNLIKNQTIDTLVAARNMNPRGEKGPNTLDAVFKNLHNNVSMEDAGLPHHDAMADTVATALILKKYIGLRNNTGEAIRNVMKIPGTSLGYTDSYLDSQLLSGGVADVILADQGSYMDKDETRKLNDIYGQNSYNNIEMSAINDLEKMDQATGTTISNFDDLTLQIKALGDSLTHLSDQFSVLTTASAQITEFGKVISHRSLINQVNALTNIPEEELPDAMHAMGIKGSMQEIDEIISLVNTFKSRKALNYGLSDLLSLGRSGRGNTEEAYKLWAQLQTSSLWDNAMDMRVIRANDIGRGKREDAIMKARAAGHLSAEQADYLNSNIDDSQFYTKFARSKQIQDALSADHINRPSAISLTDNILNYDFDTLFQKAIDQTWREHVIDKAVDRGQISPADAAKLAEIANNNDLTKSIEAVIQKSQELSKSFRGLSQIKFYDFNKIPQAITSQVSGISSSARGVVPSFLLDPISRLYQAGSNAMESSLSPVRTGLSAISNIAGPVIGGLTGGAPGAMVGHGIASGVSQIIGNFAENRINQPGYRVRSQLDLAAAVISWVATPFKLLGRATKHLIGLFNTLGFSIRNLVEEGLGLIDNMANPLTSFTGVDMSQFQDMQILEKTAGLANGSVNTAIENMAMQQHQLYKFGKVDVDRMNAAAILGIFDQVYSNDAHANKQEEYIGIANTLLNKKDMSREDIMAYAGMIDNTLPSILQVAYTQGVTDIRSLMGGGATLSEGNRVRLQRVEKEKTGVQQTVDNAKMLISADIWDAFVGDFKSGMADALMQVANHDYSGAFNTLIDTVFDLVGNITTIWDNLKTSLGKEGDTFVNIFKERVWNPLKDSASTWGEKIFTVVKGVVLGIYYAWSNLLDVVIKKFTASLAGLSTVKIDWVKLLNRQPGAITSIYDKKGRDPYSAYYMGNDSDAKPFNPRATYADSLTGDGKWTGFFGVTPSGQKQRFTLDDSEFNPEGTVGSNAPAMVNAIRQAARRGNYTKIGVRGINGREFYFGSGITENQYLNAFRGLSLSATNAFAPDQMMAWAFKNDLDVSPEDRAKADAGNVFYQLKHAIDPIVEGNGGIVDSIVNAELSDFVDLGSGIGGAVASGWQKGWNMGTGKTDTVNVNVQTNGSDTGTVAQITGENMTTNILSADIMTQDLNISAAGGSRY